LPTFFDAEPPHGVNLDDNEEALIGRAIPAGLAFLGVAFTMCAMVIAGLPPFSGFVAKLAMLDALIELQQPAAWTLFALLIVSGLFAAIALMRVGVAHFWTTQDRPAPRLRVVETLPIAALLGAALFMVSQAESVLGYTQATADLLHEPQRYIEAVLGARPPPHPVKASLPWSACCLRPGCRWASSAAGCCSRAAWAWARSCWACWWRW